MIVRILSEGQFVVPDDEIDGLNTLDSAVEKAVESGDTTTFSESLDALLHAVRTLGSPLAADSLEDSSLILPPSDATLEEVRELLGDDGLIPG
jgi:Flp pilus assembly protein CpaB